MVSSESRRTSHPTFTSANQNATQKRRDFKQREMDDSIKALEEKFERLKKLPIRTHQEVQTALEKGRAFGSQYKAAKKSLNDKLAELNLSAADEDPRVQNIRSRINALAANFNEWFGQVKKAQQDPDGSGAKPPELGGLPPSVNERNTTGAPISGSADSGSTGYLSSSGIDGKSVEKDYTKPNEIEDDATSKFPVISHEANRPDERIVEEKDGTGDSEVKTSGELQFRVTQNFGDDYGTGRDESYCMGEKNRGAQNFGDEYGTGRVEGHCMEEQNKGSQSFGDESETGRIEGHYMGEQIRGTQNFSNEFGTGMVEGHCMEEQNVDDRNSIQEMNGSMGESRDVQELREMVIMGIRQGQGCSASSSGFVNDADCIQKDHDDRNYGHTSVAFKKYGASDSSTGGFNKKDYEISVGEAEDKLHTGEPDIAVVITPPRKDLLENGGMPRLDPQEKFEEPTIQEFVNRASMENLEEEKKHTVLEKGCDSTGFTNKDMQSNLGVSVIQDRVAPAIISAGNEVSESTIDNEGCTASIIPKVKVQSLLDEEFDEDSAVREQSMDTDLCLAQWRNEVNFDTAESPLWMTSLAVKEEEDELNSLRECCYLHGQNMMVLEKIQSPEELNRTFLDKQSQAEFHGFYTHTTRSRFEDRAQEMTALDAAEENILQAAFGSRDESMNEIILMEEMINHRKAWENPINNFFKMPVIENDLCLSNGIHSVHNGQSKPPKLKKFTEVHPLEEAIKPVMDQQIQVLQEALDADESNSDESGRSPNIHSEKNINNNSSPSPSEEIIQNSSKSSRMNRKTRSMIENLGSPLSEEENKRTHCYQDYKIDVVDLVEDTDLEELHEHPSSKLTTGESIQEIYGKTGQADESREEAWHQPAMAKQKLQDTPWQPKLKNSVEEPNSPIQRIPNACKLKMEIKDENIVENITNFPNSGYIQSSVKKEVEEKPQYQVTQSLHKCTVKNEFEDPESCSEEDLSEAEESKKYFNNNRLITGNLKSIRCEFQDEDHETHSVKSHINLAGPRQSDQILNIKNCTNWFFPALMPELESISMNTRSCKTKTPLNGRVILQQKNRSSSVDGFEKRGRGMEEEQHKASIRELEENFVETEAEQRPKFKRNLRKHWLLAVMQSCMLGAAIFSFGFASQQNFLPPT